MKLLTTLAILANAAVAQSTASMEAAPTPTTFISVLRAAVSAGPAPKDIGSQLDSVLAAVYPQVSAYLANKPPAASSPQEASDREDQALAGLLPDLSGYVHSHKQPSATESPEQIGHANDEAILGLLSKKASAAGAITSASAHAQLATDAPTAAAAAVTTAPATLSGPSSSPAPSSTSSTAPSPVTAPPSADLAEQLQNALSSITDPSSVLASTARGELPASLAPIVSALPDGLQKFIKHLVGAAQDGLAPAVTIVDALISSLEQGTLIASLLLKGVDSSRLGQMLGGKDGPLRMAIDGIQNQVADVGKLVSDLVHALARP